MYRNLPRNRQKYTIFSSNANKFYQLYMNIKTLNLVEGPISRQQNEVVSIGFVEKVRIIMQIQMS